MVARGNLAAGHDAVLQVSVEKAFGSCGKYEHATTPFKKAKNTLPPSELGT